MEKQGELSFLFLSAPSLLLFEIISNKFCANRQSGLFLGNILVDEPKKRIRWD